MAIEVSRDPVVRELIAHARKTGLSRRQVLMGVGAGAGALVLAGCSTGGGPTGLNAAEDTSAQNPSLIWANWPGHLDQSNGRSPSLLNFQSTAGVTVDYKEDILDNVDYYQSIKDALAKGEDPGADLICLSEWMVARLVRFGYVQSLDAKQIPNKVNVTEKLASPDFDPKRSRSLPWLGGFGGLAWNTEEIPKGLQYLDDLWKPEYSGRVTILSELRDTMGILMLNDGVTISGDTWGMKEFSRAADTLEKHLTSGHATIKGNDYISDLESGAAIAAIARSGDVSALNKKVGYDKFAFAMPNSGGTLWSDSFVIPLGSSRATNAEKLMNYYYQPEVAASVAAAVNYITPVGGVQEIAEERYPDLANNQLIFPNETTLSYSNAMRTFSPGDDQAFNGEFQRVLKSVGSSS